VYFYNVRNKKTAISRIVAMALNATQLIDNMAKPKPLPLYSKVMRKYVVQTNINLLRSDISRAKRTIQDKEAELEKQLNGVTQWGDVTLRPSDVFTNDKGQPGSIDEPAEWEYLLNHFVEHGATDIEDRVHTLRCRNNVIKYCKETGMPLPEGY
jgi:hypothetical protein